MVFWEKVSSKIQFMLLGFPFKLSIIPFNALGKVIHKVGLGCLIPLWVEKRLDAKLHTRRIKKQRNCAIKPQPLRPLQLLYRFQIFRFFKEILDLVSLMLFGKLIHKAGLNWLAPTWGGKRLDAIGHTRRNMELRNCAIKPQQQCPLQLLHRCCGHCKRIKQHHHIPQVIPFS